MKEHITALFNSKSVLFNVLIYYTYEPPEIQQYERGVGFHPSLLTIETVKVVGMTAYNLDGSVTYSKERFGEWQKDLDNWARREVEELVDNTNSLLYEDLINE